MKTINDTTTEKEFEDTPELEFLDFDEAHRILSNPELTQEERRRISDDIQLTACRKYVESKFPETHNELVAIIADSNLSGFAKSCAITNIFQAKLSPQK